jgi:flagellin
MLASIDNVINEISSRVTTLGAAQNRIESAIESIGVQYENITSSLSTLRDADVATESSNYIKAQILQQASATLLATANQTPSIALNLL